MKIAVVTDSTAYLTADEAKANHITVVPIPVTIDGQTYQEGVNITNEEFYQKLRTSESFPSTSQPPVGELIELYTKLVDQGFDTIISMHLTGAISGMIGTVTQIAEQLKDKVKIIPVDTWLTVRMMGDLVLYTAQRVAAGDDLDTVLRKMRAYRQTFDDVFVVDDLQNLVRGGRLSNASAFVGSILKIKPLLTMHTPTHAIEAFAKVRSMKKAKLRCEQIMDEQIAKVDYPVRAIVYHANVPEQGQQWLDKLAKDHPDVKFKLSYFGPVIGTHLGEGALAVSWSQDVNRQPIK